MGEARGSVEGMPAEMNSFWQAAENRERSANKKSTAVVALLFGVGVSVADNNTGGWLLFDLAFIYDGGQR